MNEHARPAASAPHRADRVRAGARQPHDRSGRHDPHHLPGAARRLRSEPRAAVPRGGRGAARRASSCRSARGDGWRKLTYEQARQPVDALAAALLARGLSAERPVMILSANAIDHALLMLAGYTAGVPVAPISVAYSLQSQDFAKLRHIAELLDARPDLRRRHRAVRQGAGGDRRRRRDRRKPRRRQSRRDAVRRSRAHRP